MFDIFYLGDKPNVAPFEKFAESMASAASQSKTEYFWYIYGNNDYTGFNFHVTPVPWESNHIYVYGDQWQKSAGVFLAHKEHYSLNILNFRPQKVRSTADRTNWHVPENIDPASVDFSWHPDPYDPPFVYHFPSQWQSASGVTYTVPGATTIKLVSDFTVTALPTSENWNTPAEVITDSVDYSWHPNPMDPAYVYHFPSKHQSASGLTYTVPGASNIKLVDDFVVNTESNSNYWTIPDDIDVSTIDFSWTPNALDTPYVYHFSDDYQESSGLIYTVPGATEIKLLENFSTKSIAPDIFFIDKYNQQSQVRFDELKKQYPTAQKIRYANSMMETITRCVTRSKTTRFWVVSSENNYTDFDFNWHPSTWQGYMTHVFGSRLQKWSDTYLINKFEFERNSRWAKSIAEFPNLNFVDNQYVTIPEDLYDVYYIDHNNSVQNKDVLLNRFPRFKTTRFVDNYLDTLKRIMSTATTEYVWVTSSLCDYSKFDFSWQPEPWQADMLHVFASKNQKFGDTFYVPVEKFKQQMDTLELLDWFDTVNYCDEQVVPYLGLDVVRYDSDDLVSLIKAHKFESPYTVFTTTGEVPDFTPSVWRKKDRAVHTFTRSGSISVVPRDIQQELSSQLYDYPYIIKHKDAFLTEKPLDIVYISNGEPRAEEFYNRVCEVAGREVKWIKDVNGRIKANHAAAEASDTDWFFVPTGKLAIEQNFDFNWQPDRLQQPKHYIFNARNPVNGLEYGHQGMVAWNKKLVLNTVESGIDFTMSSAHEVVPLLSGTAYYNMDPLVAWRTAFREVVKLCHFLAQSPSIETEHRLSVWLTKAEGENSEWSLRGAVDGKKFYEESQGNLPDLMKSFEHDWLRERFNSLTNRSTV